MPRQQLLRQLLLRSRQLGEPHLELLAANVRALGTARLTAAITRDERLSQLPPAVDRDEQE
jgi:hypothetical protein